MGHHYWGVQYFNGDHTIFILQPQAYFQLYNQKVFTYKKCPTIYMEVKNSK